MLNLEWLRTFRTVYRTKSLSKASVILNISQPTVSQQIATLEAHVGKKLFIRKSKGVIETDDGRILNTMIAGSIESLEHVENQIIKQDSSLKTILTIGISSHLFKMMLCQQVLELGEFVHIKFGQRVDLIKDVEEGILQYAIIPEVIETFDTLCYPLFKQKLVLTATLDIDLMEFNRLYQTNPKQAEEWLMNKKWYAHDSSSSYIKLFWLHLFNKKRPSVVPNYVIPNEFETLFQLSQGSGLSIALERNTAFFTQKDMLQTVEAKEIVWRDLALIANKKKTTPEVTANLVEVFKRDRLYK